jgi:hypothetical protein
LNNPEDFQAVLDFPNNNNNFAHRNTKVVLKSIRLCHNAFYYH